MEIKLTSEELMNVVKTYVQGMLPGVADFDVNLIAGRGANGVYAEVVIGNAVASKEPAKEIIAATPKPKATKATVKTVVSNGKKKAEPVEPSTSAALFDTPTEAPVSPTEAAEISEAKAATENTGTIGSLFS